MEHIKQQIAQTVAQMRAGLSLRELMALARRVQDDLMIQDAELNDLVVVLQERHARGSNDVVETKQEIDIREFKLAIQQEIFDGLWAEIDAAVASL
jgi:hypothetical protein